LLLYIAIPSYGTPFGRRQFGAETRRVFSCAYGRICPVHQLFVVTIASTDFRSSLNIKSYALHRNSCNLVEMKRKNTLNEWICNKADSVDGRIQTEIAQETDIS
jgi:hypothetical protein